MIVDKKIMKRCFQLAKLGELEVKSNPIVGAVVVHQGRIIGEGWHEKYGEAHAEVNAIRSVRERHLLPFSTIYVSLEPCFHYGKTPPCVDLILKEKIPHVVIACQDVNPKVAGQSIQKLREAGVKVDVGVLEDEGQWLIRKFIINQTQQRPYIILKWAASQDGFIGKENEQVWLTGTTSKRLVHRWRAENMAIMVGTNTALIDNPQLSNRLYFGKHPLRVVIDKEGKIPTSHHLLDGTIATLYVTEKDRDIPNVDTLKISFDNLLLNEIMKALYQRKVKSIIVEGGATLLQSFIDQGLWDEARVFTAPVMLKRGIKAPVLTHKVLVSHQVIGNDTLKLFKKRMK